jgi:hypothetical protein
MYASAGAPDRTTEPTGVVNHQPAGMTSPKVPAARPRPAVLLDDLTASVFDDFLVTGALAPVRLWTRPPVRRLFMVR